MRRMARACQCQAGARLREKGPGCSGPHHPHVLRPNRRPHAVACPSLLSRGLQLGAPEQPANDDRRTALVASYCTTTV
jgi:hypothetical protein